MHDAFPGINLGMRHALLLVFPLCPGESRIVVDGLELLHMHPAVATTNALQQVQKVILAR